MSFCLFWVGFCGRIIFFFGDETAIFDCVGLTGLSVGDWLCVGEDFEGGGGDRGIKCFPVNGLSISFMLSSVWILFPLLRLVTLRFSGVLVILDFLKIAFSSISENIYGSKAWMSWWVLPHYWLLFNLNRRIDLKCANCISLISSCDYFIVTDHHFSIFTERGLLNNK